MSDFKYPYEELEKAVEKWKGQSRKGFLELCLLACIAKSGRIYGFALMERLAASGLDIGEGSLYPLLSRMVRERTLDAEWESPTEGHPRKYYSISPFGGLFLERIQAERAKDQAAYDAIVGDSKEE